jgi:Transposase IS116/IS110/IS902 family
VTFTAATSSPTGRLRGHVGGDAVEFALGVDRAPVGDRTGACLGLVALGRGRAVRSLRASEAYAEHFGLDPTPGRRAIAEHRSAEIGDIARFPSPRKLVGYTGLTPRVEQSGERDRRGRLRKNGPKYLRWALIEAAHTAGRDSRYRPIVERMRTRHGCARGSKIAAIEIGRRLTEAIWHILTDDRPFAPAGA